MIKCFSFLISNELGDAGFCNPSLADDWVGFFAKSEPQKKNVCEYICGGFILKKGRVSGIFRLEKKLFKACELRETQTLRGNVLTHVGRTEYPRACISLSGYMLMWARTHCLAPYILTVMSARL